MQTSIESFLLVNFAADFIILAAIAKAAGCFRTGRILAGTACATALSVMAAFLPGRRFSPAACLIMLILSSMIAAGSSNARIWIKCAVMLVSTVIITSGCLSYIGANISERQAVILSTLLALTLVYLLTFARKRARTDWTIEICISLNGLTARFHALVDTGNRLHEPISGLPVIIAEESVIDSILPESGYRNVPFGGLGGNGVLKCFRPDYIWIAAGKNMKRAPDAWIAVSETPLPGINRALAPCEFASII